MLLRHPHAAAAAAAPAAAAALSPLPQQQLLRRQRQQQLQQQQLHSSALRRERQPQQQQQLPRGCRVRAAATLAEAKRAAAAAAVERFVQSGSVVAVGHGELATLAVAALGAALLEGRLERVAIAPVAGAVAHEAAFHGVPLTTLEDATAEGGPGVALLLEQADQFDAPAAAALVGTRAEPQQPDLPRLRATLAAAARTVLLCEAGALVQRLSASLPVVIEAEDWEAPAEEVDSAFLGDAEVWRRPASGTANPRGGDEPYVSPAGHAVLDVRFYERLKLFGEDAEYARIAAELEAIPGVVTHGLLLGAADAVVVADPKADGAVRVLEVAAAATAAAGGGGGGN